MKKVLLLTVLAGASAFAQNAVVRQSLVPLLTTVAATGTATSSAVRLPNYSGYGTLTLTGTSITGSPLTCQIALEFQQLNSSGVGTGPVSTAIATQSITPGNSYQAFSITPTIATGQSMVAIWTCGTYPTGGTITVTFEGTSPVNVIGTVPVSVSSVPLPTGAATSALQTTGNTSLSSIDTKVPALGQALAASSVPIVLTASQLTTLTPPAAITGFALEAGNLATILARTPALGQALAAASTPVVLTAIQLTTLTPPAAITGFALESGNIATLAGGVTSSVYQNNVKQINGVVPLMGNGTSGTGAQRNSLSSDNTGIANWGHGATGSAVPVGATYLGGNGTGNLTGLTICDNSQFLDMTTATTTQIVALASSQKVRVCSFDMESNGTTTAKFVYGTGSNCGTGTTQLGPIWDWTAQSGIARGSGIGQLFATIASNALCVTNSAAVNLHVWVSYTVY